MSFCHIWSSDPAICQATYRLLGNFLVPFHKHAQQNVAWSSFHPPPHEIMNRLIEVTADLHLERGDCEILAAERQRLLNLAKELKLLPTEPPQSSL